MTLDPATPLVAVRSWLRSEAKNGVACPACEQRVQIYRRRLNSGMARSLIRMYLAGGLDFVHVPTAVGSRSREEGKLRYWGLVEEETTEHRPDGGRTGYWRVTKLGELFILNQAKVYSHARVYNGKCLALTGDLITIEEALSSKFSYTDLMQGVG